MAKHAKRSKRRSTGRRRRRVGAVGKADMQAIALAIGGAVLGSKLQAMLAKDPTKTTMVNLSPYAALAAGIVLPMFVKNPIVKALAVGLTTVGGLSALKKLAPGIVGNLAMIPIVSATTNRYRNLPKNSPALNGVGYTLPRTSMYDGALSVISGLPGGDGSANPGY